MNELYVFLISYPIGVLVGYFAKWIIEKRKKEEVFFQTIKDHYLQCEADCDLCIGLDEIFERIKRGKTDFLPDD